MAPNVTEDKAPDDEEIHVGPKDPDAAAAGDDHVAAKTCLLGG